MLSVRRNFNWKGFSTGTVLEFLAFASVSEGERGRSKGLLGGMLMLLGLSPLVALLLVIDVDKGL
jgi:hypothetical protein